MYCVKLFCLFVNLSNVLKFWHDSYVFFGRPFVKRFALCYQTVVCHFVCDVGVSWPNGWTDQDETWHAGRPRPWPHCVRWGPRAQPPIFGPDLLRPNGFMDQDVTWYGARHRPRRLVLDGDPAPPPQKGGRAPNFSTHVYCSQTAGWMKLVLGMEVGLGPGDFVLNPANPNVLEC